MKSPLSITKSKGSVHLECHLRSKSEGFDDSVIHWYQQKENKAPQRMLYFSEAKVVADASFRASRYRVEKVFNRKLCILTINDVTPDDAATYYCAYRQEHHGGNSEVT